MTKEEYIILMMSYVHYYFGEIKSKPESDRLYIMGLRKEQKSSVNYEDFIITFMNLTEGEHRTIAICVFKGTTTPSNYWLKNFLTNNKKGTAILQEGYHENCWAFGYHKQDRNRPALVQIAPLPVYRDGNGDEVLDYTTSTIEKNGLIGINFHTRKNASLSSVIGDTSAGCQVVKDKKNFEDHFISYVKTAISRGQKKFSYLLLKTANWEIDRIEQGWSSFKSCFELDGEKVKTVIHNV